MFNTDVVQTTNVVKLDAEYVRSQHGAVATIQDRIALLLEEKVFDDAKAWALAAGLSENYIGTIKSRGGKGNSEAVASLARAANVSTEYLIGRSEVRALARTGVSTEASQRDALRLVVESHAEDLAVLSPEKAQEVLRQLEGEFFKGGDDPRLVTYWPARLRRLVVEAQGRAKDVPRRPPPEDVDPTQESSEVRGGRKKPKRL